MMKNMMLGVALAACCGSLATSQIPVQQIDRGMQNMKASGSKVLPSPRKDARVDLNGKKVAVNYGAPSVRGRKVMGDLVPYGKWWRTGANEATAFQTSGDLMIGSLHVPAGNYTLVTIPSEGEWKLVICKHTGQWGTERFEKDDLGSTPMMKAALTSPQEVMSIDFEKTAGNKTQLHIKWENTDAYVPISTM